MMNLIKSAEIYGSEAIVYNGSDAPPDLYIDLIVNNKLEPGRGAGYLYGKGVYTTYNLPGTATASGTYGAFVYKLKVNLYGFISFNPDIARKIYGEDLTLSQQYEKVYGRKDYIFKELIALESREGFSPFSSDLADPASHFLRGRVKGLIFTGRNDGDVAVIYDPSTIVPIAWKKTEDSSWSSFSKDQIKPAIGRGIAGSFEKSKYDEVDASRDRVAKESISVLSNFDGDKLGKRETESINYLIANTPTTFLLNFSEKDWAKDYLKTAIDRSLFMISPINFIESFRNKPWFDSNSGSAAKSLAEREPYSFMWGYIDEPWAEPYIPTAAENLAKEDPAYFLYNLIDKPWALKHIPLAAKNLAESDPSTFLHSFINEPWAKEHFPLAAKNLTEIDPYCFLYSYRNEPWAKEYIPIAAKYCAEREPEYFLSDFKNEPWAQPYIELAKNKRNNMSKEDQDPSSILPTASNRSAKILKLSKALLSLGHIKEMSATRSLTTGNHKIASDEKITGKIKLDNLSEQQKEELYEVFKESYIKSTGQAWSKDLFFSRARGWTLYGIVGGPTTGVVAIREQFSGFNKLVAIAGNFRGILTGIKAVKEDKSDAPIWGAVSPEMIPMVKRLGFKVADRAQMDQIIENLPGDLSSQIGEVDSDGSFKMNIAEVGETTKKFIYNDIYEKRLALKSQG